MVKENKYDILYILIHKREHNSWMGMKQRCNNPNTKNYKNYGGRGITICDEWLNSFETFINDMGECPKGYTIERIDNNSNYCKSNCKWANRFTQARNRRNNHLVVHNNETKPLVVFCEELELNYNTVSKRINRDKNTIKQAFRK